MWENCCTLSLLLLNVYNMWDFGYLMKLALWDSETPAHEFLKKWMVFPENYMHHSLTAIYDHWSDTFKISECFLVHSCHPYKRLYLPRLLKFKTQVFRLLICFCGRIWFGTKRSITVTNLCSISLIAEANIVLPDKYTDVFEWRLLGLRLVYDSHLKTKFILKDKFRKHWLLTGIHTLIHYLMFCLCMLHLCKLSISLF